MLHAVIMAGGTGTRFWPESRAARPKQLLEMIGSKTMIRATVDRLGAAGSERRCELVPPERILIATTSALAESIAREIAELPPEAILAEPCKRNTAPCIGLAALMIARDDPDATMAVMPADHVISPDDAFCGAVRFAAELVEQQPERIVTFGIRPTYPAESFGYIERGELLQEEPAGNSPMPARAYRVVQFREKPDAKTAADYLAAGRFYWNSGIFVWKSRTILDALAIHQPEMYEHLRQIADAAGAADFDEVLVREFTAIRGISIDYAVMEHAEEVAVIEAPFEWDDVGSWQSLARLRGTDEQGNTIAAKHLGLGTTGTIVRGTASLAAGGTEDHLIVTLGLKDCLIVHTPDATLVADKHDEESIRKVVELLAEKGYEEYL